MYNSMEWFVQTFDYLEEVGVQDITFKGNWRREFVHHQSEVHDGGWRGLTMWNTINSWVYNVYFEDWVFGLSIISSAQTTALNVVMDGFIGHHGTHLGYSNWVLVMQTHYKSCIPNGSPKNKHTWKFNGHEVGVSHQCNGNVYYRNSWPSDSGINSHSDGPHNNLFDSNSGGMVYSMGGARLPNHYRGLILWNFEYKHKF
eukprot:UN31604